MEKGPALQVSAEASSAQGQQEHILMQGHIWVRFILISLGFLFEEHSK